MPPPSHSQLRRPDIAQIAKHSPPRARTVHNMNKLNGAPPNAQLHVDTRGGAQGIPEGHRAQQFPPPPSGVASSHATHHPPTPSPTFSSHSSAGGLNLSLAKSRIPLLSPRCGDQIEAVISHVVSPSLFWIQDKRSCVSDLVQQLNNFYSQANIPIPIPERGLVCCARWSLDGGWYRAQIVDVQYPMQTNPNSSQQDIVVHVFFIDYGNSEALTTRNIRCLHKKFYEVPPLALRCALAQITPPQKTGQWTNECNMFFNALCIDKCLRADVVELKLQPNGVTFVRLSFCQESKLEEGVTREEMVDVAELLVDKGLAKFIDNRVVPHSPIDVLPATVVKPEAQTPPSTSEPTSERPTGPASSTSQCSGQTVDRRPTDEVKDTTDCYCINNVVDLLPEESVVCILVTAVISPIHFWVQFVFGPTPLQQLQIHCSKSLDRPWEEGETLESLNESINNNCSKGSTKSHDMTILALGEIVLAKYSKDKKWYRSRVIFVDEDKIEVFHVDYGTSDWVTRKDVRPALPQFLHLPFQAVQCRLDGLEESQECKEQRENSRNYFEDVGDGYPLVAYVVERDIDNLLYLKLYNNR
ncbi:putative tudor domain-containing protein 1 isoform X1 [Apostichopus japonicus]|uniref:Putative tudor domain-containing protein 1 isoform X1 n=1 Tax=Stichopus japonicus TaxID=307972 RepID=A0A2G8JRT8_STIJA|nr:putative tudor domain-containing protein 1 isoform X1 [Apostichopus japonicus]